MSARYALSGIYDDMDWLAEEGALAGVGEIIRERRRQIELKGWTTQHDRDKHAGGELVRLVVSESAEGYGGMVNGSYGPAEVERQMAKSGALAAAEIDRLEAEFTPAGANDG